eukprot:354232-Chlamydomonas_euryale.AAC.2
MGKEADRSEPGSHVPVGGYRHTPRWSAPCSVLVCTPCDADSDRWRVGAGQVAQDPHGGVPLVTVLSPLFDPLCLAAPNTCTPLVASLPVTLTLALTNRSDMLQSIVFAASRRHTYFTPVSCAQLVADSDPEPGLGLMNEETMSRPDEWCSLQRRRFGSRRLKIVAS